MLQLWVLIAVIAVNLALALVILTRIKKASSTAYFAVSASFIVVWALGTLMMLFGESGATVYLGLLFFLLAPMGTTLYMAMFSRQFAGIHFPKGHVSTVIFMIFMTAIAVGSLSWLFATDLGITIRSDEQNSVNLTQPWFMLYSTYFTVMFILSYVYLILGFRHSRGRMRSQLRYVFWGIFLTSILAALTNITLPILGNSDYLWLGPAWTIFYVVTTGYAMVKHGLFDLRLALVLTFTYGLSLAALAAIYYTLALTISSLFINDTITLGENVLNVILALLLAFLFQPIRRFFDKLTSRIFYQDSYDTDDFFARLSKTLTSTTDLRSLLTRASEQIAGMLKASNASFFIYGAHAGRVTQAGAGHQRKFPYEDARWLDDVIREGIDYPIVDIYLDEDDRALRRMMITHRTSVILPLMRQETIVGYLFLGEHKKSGYTNRDIRVLRAIADELVIAIENALSVHEVKELNSTLQQRIDAATKELRASNAQLQRLDEAKDEFISMASHQLRTPLTSIKGYISMIVEGDAGKINPTQKKLLDEAFLSSERMVRLINDFLNVSRLQTGKFLIEKHETDLSQVVKQEIDSLMPSALSRGMKFHYVVPKNFPLLNLDEGKIRQVIMNFSDNAIYYSKDNSTIQVSLQVEKDEVVFKVTDTGIGVPVSEQAQLFNKFFRASNARKQRPDGTGVGLFLAKKVITAHGGGVIFESKEGKGSTFGFRLPLRKN